MRSIKPGRGPSGMNFIGSIIVIVFGIFWTIMAASMGAPIFFPIFGVIFVIAGIAQAVYHFRNATGKNRYSSFDIVDSQEEPDPLDQQFGGDADTPVFRDIPPAGAELRYCPYCGAKLGDGFTFCSQCGRKLPDIP